MTAYQEMMVRNIAIEISQIEDPFLLTVYLKAICAQRCKICGSKKGTCKDGIFNGWLCRDLYKIASEEEEYYCSEEEDK